MKFDRLILTGLHKCGKSTFINTICSKNHLLSTIRLDTRNILKNQEHFNINTYFNFFNIYDRFLYIDLFVYYKFSESTIKFVFEKIKPYFKHSIFVFGMFNFIDDPNNYQYNSEKYEIIIDILKELKYNVKVFRTKEEWIKFSDTFDVDNFEYQQTFTDFHSIPIKSMVLKNYMKNVSEFHTLFHLISPLLNETDLVCITNSFDYNKYLCIQQGIMIPNNITNIKELNTYLEENNYER